MAKVTHRPDAADDALPPTSDDLITVEDKFAMIPEWVLFHPELSDGAVRLYAVLRRYADQHDGTAFPSRAALGERMPRHTKNGAAASADSVDRWLVQLVAVGAVTKKRRMTAAGDPTSNLYTLRSSRPAGAPTTSTTNTKEGGRKSAARGGRKSAATGRGKSAAQTRATVNESHSERETGGEAARSDQQVESRPASSPSVTRAAATKRTTIDSAENGDGSAAPHFRFPGQCSKHQDKTNTPGSPDYEKCRGCMNADRANQRAEAIRAERLTEKFAALEAAPACPHGQPGGDQPHPTNGVTLCPKCRTGAPAETGPDPDGIDLGAIRRLSLVGQDGAA